MKFTEKSKGGTLNIYLNASESDIYCPVEKQSIDLTKAQYSHLENNHLADSNRNEFTTKHWYFDRSTEASDYCDFISKKQIWSSDGPIATASKLRYILSEVGEFSSASSTTAIISTHLMRVQTEFVNKNEFLNVQMKTVFNLENFPCKSEHKMILQNFE